MKKITALMAVGSLALAACGSSSSSDTGTAVSAKPASNSSGNYPSSYGGGSGGAKSSTVVQMYDNYFGPKVISGKPGATVKVQLKNVGNTEHNFKIVGQKADADVKPGTTATVSVVIPKSGSAQFYCEYHKGLGMVGTVKAS